MVPTPMRRATTRCSESLLRYEIAGAHSRFRDHRNRPLALFDCGPRVSREGSCPLSRCVRLQTIFNHE